MDSSSVKGRVCLSQVSHTWLPRLQARRTSSITETVIGTKPGKNSCRSRAVSPTELSAQQLCSSRPIRVQSRRQLPCSHTALGKTGRVWPFSFKASLAWSADQGAVPGPTLRLYRQSLFALKAWRCRNNFNKAASWDAAGDDQVADLLLFGYADISSGAQADMMYTVNK